MVAKLFNIIDPDISVFGQKDAQQAIIIKKMVQDLNFKTKILVTPTIRENDGLAMSSRNKYLNAQQRNQAVILYQSLSHIKKEIESGKRDLENLRLKVISDINDLPDCKVDYVEFVNPETLDSNTNDGKQLLCLVAVFIGKTRLIDNMLIEL